MDKEYIYIGAIMIAMMSMVMTFMLYYVNKKKQERKEEQLTRAELSYMREYFEKKIYELNDKLASDKDRWKEINHLLLSYNPKINETYFQAKPNFNSSFFESFGINPKNLEVSRNFVFVLTPFYNEERETFDAVQMACREIGLQCLRGDEEFIKGDVFSYILERIFEARIIIANINGRNPNVFYELGIAQAIGKPTLLISKSIEDVPFDLRSQNIIIYNSLSELNHKLINMFSRLLINEK